MLWLCFSIKPSQFLYRGYSFQTWNLLTSLLAFTNPEKNVLISTPIVSSDYFSYFYFESRNTRRNRNVYQFHAAKEKKHRWFFIYFIIGSVCSVWIGDIFRSKWISSKCKNHGDKIYIVNIGNGKSKGFFIIVRARLTCAGTRWLTS